MIEPEGEIVAPIEIEGAPGMRAAEVRIQYDPTMMSTDQASVTAGSIWGDHAMVLANVDNDAGTIVAFVFSVNEAPHSSGRLLNIDFQSTPHAHAGRELAVDLQRVRINEGQVPLDVDPQLGADSTDTTAEQRLRSRKFVNYCTPPELGTPLPMIASAPIPHNGLTASGPALNAVDDIFRNLGRHGQRLY